MWLQAGAVLAMLRAQRQQYARNLATLRMSWLRVCRPATEYAADSGRQEAATPANPH
jgi:hypothetical protein